jgi:catechol 2,3-dioxygenase-like lactoylglutathione lyase family enzyme
MKSKFVRSCDHIGIFTNHYQRLVNFYTQKLGFVKEKEERLSKSLMRSVFGVASEGKFTRLAAGDVRIEIFFLVSGRLLKRSNRTLGYNHWAVCVTDVKKFLSGLNRKGVKIITIKRNDHFVFFVKDPDSNRIEVKECKTEKLPPRSARFQYEVAD